jgi:TonB dependent receptor/TonB-dependent Receptor Plug Domain/CarboxypepD_reg-like domain
MKTCLRGGALALVAGALAAPLAVAQQPAPARVTFSGYVRDASTGENLIGVAVVHPASGQGTSTNTYGFFSLTLPAADTTRLLASYLGYQRLVLPLSGTRSQQLTLRLQPASSELQSVEIVGTRQEKLAETTRMGTANIPLNQIKAVPALFGERDVLKVLQLLPGVQSGGEGQNGLYVRGGSPDQNLILLDGTPVYNASHLFGFFSVFNADALNNVELVKGGFPARYGGRLSSVLDISMKEGNMQEFHGEGGIGLIASRVTLEGPIKKDTASFIISARRTYIDVLARPLIKLAASGTTVGYFFHDVNAKVNWKLGRRDRLYLSAYTGRDEFYARYKDKYNDGEYAEVRDELGWGNLTAALRWNHVLNDRLFANTHLTFSRYQFDVGIEDKQVRRNPAGQLQTDKFTLQYLSNIRDWSVKTDFDYVPLPDHYVRFGGQYIWHQFRPGAIQARSSDPDFNPNFNAGTRTHAQEMGLYAEDDYKVTERLKVNAGLRLNGFVVRGKLFPSVEPRLAARYLIGTEWALKASYARTTQFIHLLANSGIGLPTDLWVPATPRIKPQKAQQVSVGAARNLRLGGEDYELSSEVYYKPMQRLIEYREGASFLGSADNDWESQVTSGKGWAYGWELFVQKKTGRTTGWIGYTLAWSKRQFPELNQGRIYPFKYDRRHDASLVIIHQLSPTLRLSGTWVYGTGNAVTLSRGRYSLGYDWGEFEDYGPRNSYRMRAYHRMDLDLSQTKKKKWGEIVNSFSLYNAYSRRNPYFLYFRDAFVDVRGNQQPAGYRQISLFPVLPSFSKSFKF